MNPVKFIEKLNRYKFIGDNRIDEYTTKIRKLCEKKLFKIDESRIHKDLHFIIYSLLKKEKDIEFGKKRLSNGSMLYWEENELKSRKYKHKSKHSISFLSQGIEANEVLSWLPISFRESVYLVQDIISDLKNDSDNTFIKKTEVSYSYRKTETPIIIPLYENRIKNEEVYYKKKYNDDTFVKGKFKKINAEVYKSTNYHKDLHFKIKFQLDSATGETIGIDSLSDENLFFFLNNIVHKEVKKAINSFERWTNKIEKETMKKQNKFYLNLKNGGYMKYLLAREL